jgi:hypothetical protein
MYVSSDGHVVYVLDSDRNHVVIWKDGMIRSWANEVP